jgi:hypothetical protein
VKSVFHVRIIDRPTGAAMFAPIRFKSKRRNGPFEIGQAIVMAPPGSDMHWEDAVMTCEVRLFRLAELLDERRRRKANR